MTTAHQAPSTSTTPAAPPAAAWMLYIYPRSPTSPGRAFLTFNGRLVASATCTTPAQEARIEGLFHRLDQGQVARRSAQATYLAIDRRPESAI